MFARMTKKGKLGMLIAFALVICVVVCSYAEVLMPEATGKKVQKDGKLLVDSSNCSEGYIMVRTKKDNKRMKLRITMGGSSLNYDINSDGNFEVFPLQFAGRDSDPVFFIETGGNQNDIQRRKQDFFV